jgi:dipeptidyl aminopeptidase/acylaminoacyl peptidase
MQLLSIVQLSIVSPCFSVALAAAPSLDEVVSLRRVGAPALSPDGRRVAYTVREANWDEDAFEREIWVADVESGEPRQLTRGKKSSWAPAFSPDGEWLAFLSDREEKAQVFLIRPTRGEASRLTTAEQGVSSFAWAPDGKLIAYLTEDPPSEPVKEREKRFGKLAIVDEDLSFTHLHVVDVAKKTSRRLTQGSFTVESFDWSPDGVEIAFEHWRSPDPADLDSADLSVVHVAGGTVRPLVSREGPDTKPVFSPDGSRIAFNTARTVSDYYYANTDVAIVPAAGGATEIQSGAFDEDALLLGWGRSGLYFEAAQRTDRSLFRLDVSSRAIDLMAPEAGRVGHEFAFDAGFTQVAYVGSDATQVAEIEVAPLGLPTPPRRRSEMWKQLTAFRLPPGEVISWVSRDGVPIEGVLYRPADQKEGERRPLVVVVHGGPTATSRPRRPATEHVYPIDQWLARGALVLLPNYRGSGGYGERFRSLNVRNLGLGDAWDVLSGIDLLVNQGLVETSRVGVAGWSQGGYIAAFLATHDGARFKAASVGAGISDWLTYYVNTDIHPFTLQYLKATPWQDPEIYRKTSPITYLSATSPPTLIQHGAKDQRVPLPNAFELYQGLRDHGVTTRLVVYEGFGHGLDKPKAQRAALQQNLDWFDRHLFQIDPETEPKETAP